MLAFEQAAAESGAVSKLPIQILEDPRESEH